MAKCDLTLTVRFKWWVKPLMLGIGVAALPIAIFYRFDADKIDAFCARLGAWVSDHGMRIEVL